MGKGKSSKGGGGGSKKGGAAEAAKKCTCDHPYQCSCGNRPERPSRWVCFLFVLCDYTHVALYIMCSCKNCCAWWCQSDDSWNISHAKLLYFILSTTPQNTIPNLFYYIEDTSGIQQHSNGEGRVTNKRVPRDKPHQFHKPIKLQQWVTPH